MYRCASRVRKEIHGGPEQPRFPSCRSVCRSCRFGRSTVVGAGQHTGTMRAGIIGSIEIAPMKPIFVQIPVRVHPLTLSVLRANLIAEVSASDTEAHRR